MPTLGSRTTTLKFYTGVGSRDTPNDIQVLMMRLAHKLYSKGWILRSGGAGGADKAFEMGVPMLNGNSAEIYLPWDGFRGMREQQNSAYLSTTQAELRAEAKGFLKEAIGESHFNNLKGTALKLHARNVFQVLGKDLQTPSKLLICWTKGGKDVGGTATAIKLARMNNIKVYNLGIAEDLEKIVDWLK